MHRACVFVWEMEVLFPALAGERPCNSPCRNSSAGCGDQGWWRAVQGWSWGRTFNSPRMQAPACLSLGLTALGIGGAGALGIPPNRWWMTLIWGGLSILFFVQFIMYTRSAQKNGWDSSLDSSGQVSDVTATDDVNSNIVG